MFGTNGFVDAFYLDFPLHRSPVYSAQHDTGAFAEIAPGFASWADDPAREDEYVRRRMEVRHGRQARLL
jgi:hypothetical protein